MRIIREIKLLCMTALLSGCHSATTDMEQFVDELYNKMSQEERILFLWVGSIRQDKR